MPTARPTPPRFEGFADTRGRFFEALLLHNDRDWFQAHRAEYEEGWRAPMALLLAELRARLLPLYRGVELAPPKVFRINRDVRFSREKVPYKTHVAGLLSVAGPGGPMGGPAVAYLHVSHHEAFTGGGIYAMEPPALARHRRELLHPRRGPALARLAEALEAEGFTLEAIETLKRAPAGVPADHPRLRLLRMKGLVAMAPPIPRRLLVRRELLDHVEGRARAVAPLVRRLLAGA